MKAGLFMMPSHPPERSLIDGHLWDRQVLRWADELGYQEAWIGEHFTSPWEPNPAPDLLIAQSLLETKNIILAPGAHLLPYHHPAELATRVAFLDHMAQGRFMLGIGASGLPSDWHLFEVDGLAGVNREMMREAIDIMLQIWETDGPLKIEGKYWNVHVPGPMLGTLKHHLKPFQKPRPPIGTASLSPGSESLRWAGTKGFLPLSLSLSTPYLKGHWDAYAAGCESVGREARYEDWRVVREVFVADTDEEAYRWSVQSHLGRMERDYLLGLFRDFDYLKYLKDDPEVPDSEVTPEWLAHNGWLIGSPQTVTEKLDKLNRGAGGIGVLTVLCYDYSEDPEPWRRSMELFIKDVMPNFADSTAGRTAAAD